MSTGNSDREHEPQRPSSRQRQDRRVTNAAKSDALRKAFGNGAQPAPDDATATRSADSWTTSDAAGTSRNDRLVSEAVVAGLDAMAASHARVAVGAGAGRGGEPPPRPEASAPSWRDEVKPAAAPPRTDTPVVAPVEHDQELADAIAKREPRPHPVAAIGTALDSFLREAGELTLMGGQVFKSAVLHPRGYWGDVKDQVYDALKLCSIPMLFAVLGFGFGAPGLQGGNILYLFGVPDRLGGFFMFATIREFAPFVEAMVVAGVVGTAITADLGARRIREEIDAMEVLGVDPVRKLILPRVISTIIMTAFFDLFAIIIGIVSGYFAGVFFLGSSPSGFVASFFSQANISDDWGSFVKCAIFGLIIGLVCSYKGYRAKGGPAGVGRAVNQAVVVSFALIWVVDYTFTNLLLGYAPSTQVIK